MWSGTDLEKVEVLVNIDSEEPSWWVWVSEEMVPSKIEEKSGIDDEAYVIVSEELVVDGVAYFMARCILANPKTQVCDMIQVLCYSYMATIRFSQLN